MLTDSSRKKSVQVCFTPALFPFVDNISDSIVVVIDVLRATTAICAAFDNGVKEIMPVAGLDEAESLKAKGFLVAAERDGIKADFADFGNSPLNFKTDIVKGKTIVYSTTNGTQVIALASDKASEVIIGAFNNLKYITAYLEEKDKNVVILCAGWKNRFNLEDSLCAGAITQELLNAGKFFTVCDSATASIDLWEKAKDNLIAYADKCAHRHRLKKLGLDDVIEMSFTLNSTAVLPVLKGDKLIDVLVGF